MKPKMMLCIAFLCCYFIPNFAEDWKRVYLASFPRSGNHWVRYLIEEATHVATSSVYCDPKPQHLSVRFPWIGFCMEHGYYKNCRYPEMEDIIIVKTHFPHLVPEPGDGQPYLKTIHIVRHPVDCFYSLYLFSYNGIPPEKMPRNSLLGFIYSWREFEEYWSQQKNVLTIRYEDLFNDPYPVFKQILSFIGYQLDEKDILRALSKFPPTGAPLKHLPRYSEEELALISFELKEWLQKYDYHIPK